MLVHRCERRRVSPVSPVLARAAPKTVCVRPCSWSCRAGTEGCRCLPARARPAVVRDFMGADEADVGFPASPSASVRAIGCRGGEPGCVVAILSTVEPDCWWALFGNRAAENNEEGVKVYTKHQDLTQASKHHKQASTTSKAHFTRRSSSSSGSPSGGVREHSRGRIVSQPGAVLPRISEAT